MPIFLGYNANSNKSSSNEVVGNCLGFKYDLFDKTYGMEIKKVSLNVKIHNKNTFSETEKNAVRNYIHNAVNEFVENVYCFSVNVLPLKVEICLIDTIDQYKQYCDQYRLLGKDMPGVTCVGNRKTPYHIYLYKDSDSIAGLKRELSYVMQDHVTGHKLSKSVDSDFMLSVISDTITDLYEYGYSFSDQIYAARRVLNKIYSSGESDEYSNKSICNILKKLKDSNFKSTDITIQDFEVALLNFEKKIAGKDFCTLLFSAIKQEDSSLLNETLFYFKCPINSNLFKQPLEEQGNSSVCKGQSNISRDVTLQNVVNHNFNRSIESDGKLHVVKHRCFDDQKVAPTVACNNLSKTVNNLDREDIYGMCRSAGNQVAIGLPGPVESSSMDHRGYTVDYGTDDDILIHRKVANGNYDTPPIEPMDVCSITNEECLNADSGNNMSGKLDLKKFKSNVFCKVHTIRNDDFKLNLEVHTMKVLPERRLDEIEKVLNDTIQKFKNSFGLEPNDKDTTFEMYLFDNKEQYEYYGKLYNLGISGSGGKTFYGNADSPYQIYVYKSGKIFNLSHELAHALEGYACGHRVHRPDVNGNIFAEGLAEYIQDDNDFILKLLKNKEVVSDILHSEHDDINKVIGDAVVDKQHLHYGIGQVFVTFLQQKHPGVISEYFKASKSGNFHRAIEMINMNKYPDFEDWIKSKEISVYLEDMNVLKLNVGDRLLSYDHAKTFEMPSQHNEYYSEKICNIGGKVVGEMSPVAQYGFKNVIRSWNAASHDMIEVDQNYSFLKLVNSPSGKSAYVYCNKDGKEYFNTESYVNYAFNILTKYYPKIAEVGDCFDTNKQYDIDKAFAGIPNSDLLVDKYLTKTNATAYKDFILRNPDQYRNLKIHVMDDAFQDFKSNQVKQVLDGTLDISPEIRNIILDLTYIDLKSVIGVNGFDIKSVTSDPNVMLHAVILGKGDKSGISLYMGDNKVGELLTECGYCVKDIDTGKFAFVFRDVVKMISSSYVDKAYIVVSEENGKYNTALVDDIQKAGTENVIWSNHFSHPNISNFYPGYEDFLLRNASMKTYNHIIDKKFAPKTSVIVPGELLDDKGTVSVDDDVYRAVVTRDDNILHQFKSMSFYISEPSYDSKGNFGSDFYITDEGKGIRFQLPKTITHLKLVNVKGSKKLVPCTADGNEHPDGMPPDLTDEYRYIDPIFVHKFEQQCYSKKSKSIGLVDLNKYQEGTLFKLQHYDEDYHINRDEHGNIIRPKNVSYNTKVDLLYDGKIIGMLSDNINQFQGDIFISVSRNYSHSDFLSSKYFQKVNIQEVRDGVYHGTYDVSDEIADLGTDSGYSDHTVFYFNDENSSHYSTGTMSHYDFL